MNWALVWGAVGAVAALLGAVVALTIAIVKWGRHIAQQNEQQLAEQEAQRQRDEEFKRDWNGVPARPGVPAVDGVMKRLETIEGNTKSLPDRMTAVEEGHKRNEAGLAELRVRLDDHILMQHPPAS